MRLNVDGSVDSGFTSPAFQQYGGLGSVTSVKQQANNRLLIGGTFHSLGGFAANNLVRVNTDGTRDPSFDASVAAGPCGVSVNTLLVRSDGKIFAGGYFSTYGGVTRGNIAWVGSDGSVDSTFADLSGATDRNPQIYALAVQGDGKIIAGGFFSSFNGLPRNNIVRLFPDGVLDPSFDATLGTDGDIRACLVQTDGKIIIGGNFLGVDGINRGHLARLNSDGTLDTSFDTSVGADSTVYSLMQDLGGNTYVGGAFILFNGSGPSMLSKLSGAGVVDPNFNHGNAGPNDVVYAIAPIDSTGGIVIGGNFTTYNGLPNVRRIARVNASTGALDVSFTQMVNVGFSGAVRSLLLATDGKYYAGGIFTTFNGQSRQHVARLNTNGSNDSTFTPPSNNGLVFSVVLQNGKLFAGGNFSTPTIDIARLSGTWSLGFHFLGWDRDAVFSDVVLHRWIRHAPHFGACSSIRWQGAHRRLF